MSEEISPDGDPESNHDGKKQATRRRKSVPKVRTGCRMCKRRHMRCDERKPFCKNCEDFRVQCPGYPGKSPEPRRPARLVPKPRPSLDAMAGGISFADASEHRYFMLAIQDVGPDVANIDLKLPVMINLMVQSCRSEEALRQGMAAIGAMKEHVSQQRRIMYLAGPVSSSSKLAIAEAEVHRTWAINQYSTAITTLRKSSDLRTILIGCWLIFCFENLCGSPGLAANHLETGLKLLQDWITLHGKIPASPKAISPHPAIIEDSIINVYMGLDALLAIFNAKPVAPFHLAINPSAAEYTKAIPQAFNTLQEAQVHLQRIMALAHRFAGSPHPQMPVLAGTTTKLSIPAPISPFLLPAETSITYAEQSQSLDEWSMAFSALEPTIDITPFNIAAITALKIHHLKTFLVLQSTTFSTEEEHDALIPYYRTLVELCKSLFEYFRSRNTDRLPKSSSKSAELDTTDLSSSTFAHSLDTQLQSLNTNFSSTNPLDSTSQPSMYFYSTDFLSPRYSSTTFPPPSTLFPTFTSQPPPFQASHITPLPQHQFLLSPSILPSQTVASSPSSFPSSSSQNTDHTSSINPTIFDIVTPLTTIAQHCRHPHLRRAGISLLQSASDDQIYVDLFGARIVGVVGAAMSKWILDAEEENLVASGGHDASSGFKGKATDTIGIVRGAVEGEAGRAEENVSMVNDRDRLRYIRVIVDTEERKGKIWCLYPARRVADGRMEGRDGEFRF